MNAEALHLLRRLNFSGIAVTAAIREDGTLEPVDKGFDKLLAAARKHSLPQVHTVVVAKEQKGVPDELKREEPHVPFRVIFASDVFDAIKQLAVDAQTRWKDIIDCTPELNRHRDFVGRQWLKERVQAFVDSHDNGYLILTGGPGVGKSAFVAEQVRSAQEHPVFHFIKRGMGNWDEPDAILHSLTAQLRKYALPKTDAEQDMTPGAAFLSVLQRVSHKLTDGQKAVIYLDGLDEAFGPTGRFAQVALPGILPRVPPEGIKMILTSRPGEHLDWLAEPTVYQFQSFDKNAQDNRDDIRTYLRQQNRGRNLGLGDDFIELLLDASEGFFAIAVLYLRERENLHTELQAWQRDQSLIPKGLEGWITEQWKRLIAPLPPKAPNQLARWSPPSQDLITAILGLMATAREPLSRNHLMTFLKFAIRHTEEPIDSLSIGFLTVAELGKHLNEVLRLSQELFEPIDMAQGAAAPYRFFLTRFQEFIMDQLSDDERQDCHRLLAQGCAGWQHFQGAVRDYALRHRLAHLIATQEWEQVAQVFAEADFIVERSERFDFAEVHADALTAAEHPNLPLDWKEAFREWERFLRWRIERLRHFESAYPQEVFNEFIKAAPRLLGDALTPLRDGFSHASILYLRKTFGPPALNVLGHTHSVWSVAFSCDSRLIASGSADMTVKVWEVESGRLVADCIGYKSIALNIAFSPDNQFVVSRSRDQTVKVWEAQTGRLVVDYIGRTTAISPNGCLVASVSGDNTAKVWEAQTGRLVADGIGHEDVVLSIAFSPDSRFVVSRSRDQTVKVWEAQTGRLVADGIRYEGPVGSVAISPDGQFIAIRVPWNGSFEDAVKVWEVKTGRLVAECIVGEYDLLVTWLSGLGDVEPNVVFSPDGRFMASGDDGTVKVWEAQTGRLLADCIGRSNLSTNFVLSIAFSPDSQFVASGFGRSTVKVWEARTGRLIADCIGHEGPVRSVAFSTDRRLVSGGDDNAVKVWNIQTKKPVAHCIGHVDVVSELDLSSNGQFMASAGDKIIKVREAQTGQLLADHIESEHRVRSVAISSDGRFVAAGTTESKMQVWEAQSGKLVADCFAPDEPEFYETYNELWGYNVYSVAFSSDGQLVAAGIGGTGRKEVQVWETQTGRLVAECEGHQDSVLSVAISPYGRLVAAGSRDNKVQVWEAQTGRLVADCIGHEGPVLTVAFSPDGRFVTSGSIKVKVWEAQTGRLVADCIGHEGPVLTVAFSPCGRFMASGSYDKIVKMWNAQTGECINTLFFSYDVHSVAFLDSHPLRVVVADKIGQVFGYEVIDAR